MEYLLSPEGLQDLMMLLLWGVALILFAGWFIRYCKRTDDIMLMDRPPDNDRCPNTVDVIRAQRYPVDHSNIDQVLAHHGVSAEDRADILKGSKLS